jgi:Glycosyl hydrolase family 79, N-terminal domain
MKFFNFIVSWLFIFISTLFAQSSIDVSIDTKTFITNVSKDFIGLSFEMEKVLPDQNVRYFFSSANKSLIATFKTLGIKSLRVGGNTADRPTIKIPNETDIDTLFAFAKAAGVKIIYTLRLKNGNPEQYSDIVKYIMDNYKSLVDCFAIGNEPNVFAKEYQAYSNEWKKYVDLIISKSPDAKFCGPSTTPGKAEWCRNFVKDFSGSGVVKFISQHAYPGGNGYNVKDMEKGRIEMLSSSWVKSYRNFYNSFGQYVKGKKFRYRIEETNNFYNGGADGVSNTFASTLWGLDYMFWWAYNEALGINFHTGDSVAAGESIRPCHYTAFITSPEGYSIRPLGYAIKAFEIAGKGKILPVNINLNKNQVNVEIYSTFSIDKNIFITIINKEIGSEGRGVDINFNLNDKFKKGEGMFLTSPGNNVAATSGIKLGGAEIKDNADWDGKWVDFTLNRDGSFTFNVPVATIAIIKLVK